MVVDSAVSPQLSSSEVSGVGSGEVYPSFGNIFLRERTLGVYKEMLAYLLGRRSVLAEALRMGEPLFHPPRI